MFSKPRIFLACVISLCALAFAGCTASRLAGMGLGIGLDPGAYGIFSRTDVNLTQKSYAAADILAHQAQTFIRGNDLIKVLPLTDIQEPGISSQIGKLIPEQIGVRFSQLGYAVDLDDVATAPDLNYLKPYDESKKQKPFFTISGTYFRRRQNLDISLRIIDLQSGRIVSAFDYSLLMTSEIADLAESEARIFKIDE